MLTSVREGHESITSLKEAYKDKIAEHRRATFVPPPESHTDAQQQQQQATPKQSPFQQPLSSYLELEKISFLPVKEIEYLWRLRNANDKLSLCATIPLETYHRMYTTAKAHPQFILPIPRPAADDGSGDIKQSESGFEGGERTAADVHFLQWGFHPPAGTGTPPSPEIKSANTHTSTVIFTHLAAFKLHGTYAQPHTTVTHHLELADTHGIVLLNGSVVDGGGVSVEEGRWLLMCLQKFYDFEGHGGGIGKEKRQGLLEKFSKGDERFSLEELVDEAERIS
jgi:ATP synthase mitochondrial F1 complex assembly factor 1